MPLETSPREGAPARLRVLFSIVAASVLPVACGGGDDDAPAPAPAPPAPQALTCDDTMKAAFKPDANTTVLLVKSFKAGDPIALSGTTGTPPVAAKDLCLVKLLVGPGNPGTGERAVDVDRHRHRSLVARRPPIGTGASTSWAAAVGQAVQIPRRTIAHGDDGHAATIAGENSVVATTDTGHPDGNGSFVMKPDGTINSSWAGLLGGSASRADGQDEGAGSGLYLDAAQVFVLDGCSTGGRQGSRSSRPIPTTSTATRRLARLQLDRVHHRRALSVSRLPARSRRRSAHRGAAAAARRQGA